MYLSLQNFITRFVSASIMMMTYGHQVKGDDDVYVKLAKLTTEALNSAGSGGAALVDFFPFCRLQTQGFFIP